MSTSPIYHSVPLLLPRATGTIARLGGQLYDQIPEQTRRPLFTYIRYILQGALIAAPLVGVLASVKITYIALAALALLACLAFVSVVLKRGSQSELNKQFVNWSAEGDLKNIAFAIAAGADLNFRVERIETFQNSAWVLNETALMRAAARGHLSTVRMLVELGANVGFQDARATALVRAAEGGHGAIVRELWPLGRDADSLAENRVRAFVTAALNANRSPASYIPIVEMIIDEMGMDVNAQDEDGNTALTMAEQGHATALIEVLVRRGANHE